MAVSAYDVLAVSGSPRGVKGNSTILLEVAKKRLKELGFSVFSFDCCETRIEPCRGCLKCNQSGICVQKDVFSEMILPIFEGCYGVILSSPVYFWDVSAQLKSFIDRFRVAIRVSVERERIVCLPKVSRKKDVVVFFAQGEVRSSHYSGALNTVNAFVKGVCGGRLLDVVVARAVPLSRQIDLERESLSKVLKVLGVDADEKYVERLLREYANAKSRAEKAAERLAEAIRKS
ncbi:MAG: flavodoxin family protein [Planctomycetota bacterium]|nr:flavodoxin family protein [Planctomycetota bacterium]